MDLFTVLAMCYALNAKQAELPIRDVTNCEEAKAEYHSRLRGVRLSRDDREAIARVTYAEASNQGDAGLAGVIYTILNRLISGKFGYSVTSIIDAPYQFEPAHSAGGWRRLPALSPEKKIKVETIINLALEGRLPDPTNGALYFQNPDIVASRERKGKVSKGLTHFGGAVPSSVIRDHHFYASINPKFYAKIGTGVPSFNRDDGYHPQHYADTRRPSNNILRKETDYRSAFQRGLDVALDGEYYLSSLFDKPAFVSNGLSMETEKPSPKVAASMINLALAKSWSEIKVQGTEEFKREVWLQASVHGIKVVGYEPGIFDHFVALFYW
ncbi:LPD7 domain-containing protein [Veronia pacifica]|uniref:Cell wall hydrolase SleB domain-containing protein n=1 Tax=Veronia pacifica TaxID=1080227 RepID=A0A1C3ERN3_9GAMM|nr:LPD7 domain-containing protein [Veronia pacifica]ODA35881.1 hypothetical protein A8L45_02275 [Veronia pacifica]